MGSLPERIFLNMAMTLDGKITTCDGTGSKFASQADQERMLQIRSSADAIIIGAGTAITDNPHLKFIRPIPKMAEGTGDGA